MTDQLSVIKAFFYGIDLANTLVRDKRNMIKGEKIVTVVWYDGDWERGDEGF